VSRLRNAILCCGALALLAATATDTLAVIGRHVGMPLPGSIELMQAFVLVVGATSLVMSSIAANHARVGLLVDRLSDVWRPIADRVSSVASALFFLALLIGSGWIAIDLWFGHEVSEVVGLPWRVLRLIANACLLLCLAITVRRVFTGDGQ
jgi:TRAP-type C4-dicarboxylate transport system permease small subunit